MLRVRRVEELSGGLGARRGTVACLCHCTRTSTGNTGKVRRG